MIWTIAIVIGVLLLLGLFEEGDMADYSDQDLLDELNRRP